MKIWNNDRYVCDTSRRISVKRVGKKLEIHFGIKFFEFENDNCFFIPREGFFKKKFENSSYHMRFRDCEPHNYTVRCSYEKEVGGYRCTYLRDNEILEEYIRPLDDVGGFRLCDADDEKDYEALFVKIEKNREKIEKIYASGLSVWEDCL